MQIIRLRELRNQPNINILSLFSATVLAASRYKRQEYKGRLTPILRMKFERKKYISARIEKVIAI